MDVGNLTARLSLDTSKFTSSIKAVMRSMTSVTSSINSIGKTGVSSFNNMRKAMDGLAYSAKGAGKEIGRITQGIVFSQMFYRSVNAIQSAIGAVFDLSKQAETATASFMVLLKSEEQAVALVEHLKNFAAETQFSFETASAAAKQLLAYGFQVQELDRMMTAIGDASAAMGDTEAFDRIAKALGQIRTKGKLASQELLQLTEAGIPAYEILQKQLGLTKDQLADIGRLGIDANTAIEALVRGIEQNYGGAMELLADTVDGYLNNIKESFTSLMSEIFKPFYNNLKEMLKNFSKTLNEMRQIVNDSGVGGLINSMFSAETAAIIRQLLGAFQILGASIKNFATSLAPLVKEFVKVGATVLGIVIPAISFFLNILSALLQMVTANTTVMNAFRLVITALLIIKSVTILVRGLATAFALLTSPVMLVVGGLTALIALFASFAGQGSKIVGVINGIGQAINNLYGLSNESILPEEVKDPPDFDSVVGGLEDTSDALEDAGDSAKKAAKNLMSFDEVFNLTEKDTSTGLEDFELPELETGNPLAGLGSGFDISGAEASLFSISDAVQKMVDKIKSIIDSNGGVFGSLHKVVDTVADGLIGMCRKVIAHLKSSFGPAWSDFWDGTEQILVGWIDGIRQILHGVIDVVDGVIEIIAGVVTGDWERAWNGLHKAMEGLGGIAKGAVTIVEETLQGLLKWLRGVFGPSWDSTFDMLIDVVGHIGDGLRGAIDGIVEIFYSMIEILMSIITNDWQLFWDGLYRITDNTKLMFDSIIEALRLTIDSLVEWLKSIFGPAWDFVWDGVGKVLQGALTVIDGAIDGIVEIFEGLVEFLIGIFTGDWDLAWQGIATIFQGFSDGIKTMVDGLNEIFDGIIVWLKGIFGPEWDVFWDGIARIFDGICIAVKGTVDGLLQILYGVIEFLVGIFTGDWEMVWSGIQNILDGAVLGIKGILDGIVEALMGVIDWIGSWFGPNWEALWKFVGDLLYAFKAAVKGILEGLVEMFKGLVEFLIGVFTGDWDRAWNGIKQIFDGVCTILIGILDGLLQAFLGFVNWISTTLSNMWKSAWGYVERNFNATASSLKQVVEGLKKAFKGIIDFIVGVFTGNWKRAWEGVKSVFKGIFDSLVSVVKTPLNFIIDLVNKAIDGINSMISNVNKVPGVNIGTIGRIPRLAKGGLVTKHTLAEIGEGNKQEAVIPLENGHAIDTIAGRILEGMEMLAGGRSSQQNNTGGYEGIGGSQVMYVGTLIADDRSLRELERRMKVVRLEEEGRRG